MNDTPRKSTVSLEDLLRIKRAERPPQEFWDEFERGMRTKQLAAIVEPRPWWAPFIRVGARVSRFQLPVGAAAILAITFVTLHEYRTVELAPAYEPAVATLAGVSPSKIKVTNATSSTQMSAPSAASEPVMVADAPSPAAPVADAQPEQMAPVASRVGGSSHLVPVQAELTPSARYMAAARAADPEIDQMLDRSIRSVESHVSRVEPLAQVSVPGESRRSRFLAGMTWSGSTGSGSDSSLRTDDHSARHLTETRLSESDAISRVDVDGSRLTVRF